MLIDTHAHICDVAFDPDRAEVLDRARAAGVTAVVAVGEDLADAEANLALAGRFSMLRPAAGLYPDRASPEAADAMIAWIRTHRSRLWAVGEVGIDFWIAKTEFQRGLQEEIFARFIDLAVECDLPLNVHSRSAGRRAVEILIRQGAEKVQLHAFDGKFAAAEPAVSAGHFFSIPPSVVRSRQKQKLVGRLPLASMLAETDSPVLGAEPGERNQPARLKTAVEAIARIKGLSVPAVIEALAENTRALYGPRIGDGALASRPNGE